MQQVNPKLLAVAGHDLHRKATFSNVGMEFEAREFSQSEILHAIKHGLFAIKSRFFRVDPQAKISWGRSISLQLLGPQLMHPHGTRDFFLRWSG